MNLFKTLILSWYVGMISKIFPYSTATIDPVPVLFDTNNVRVSFKMARKNSESPVLEPYEIELYADMFNLDASVEIKARSDKQVEYYATFKKNLPPRLFTLTIYSNKRNVKTGKTQRKIIGIKRNFFLPGKFFLDEPKDLNTQEIPKIIWSYWEQGEMPDLVKRCVSILRNTTLTFKSTFSANKLSMNTWET